MTHVANNERGFSLVVILAILFMMTVAGVQMLTTSVDDFFIAGHDQETIKAFYTAESGLAIARSKLWTGYVNATMNESGKRAGQAGDRSSYRKYLEAIGLKNGATLDLVSSASLGNDQVVDLLTVRREDDGEAVVLTITSSGRAGTHVRQVLTEIVRIDAEQPVKPGFAIIARNVDCTLCHASIDNAARIYNNDVSKKGSFAQARMAVLNRLCLSPDSAESYLAGTLYNHGLTVDMQGRPLSELSSFEHGLMGRMLIPDGSTIDEPLIPVHLKKSGIATQLFASVDGHYAAETAVIDEELIPQEIESIFPDFNDNCVVDDPEYRIVASRSTGTVSGGTIYGVASQEKYPFVGMPASSNLDKIDREFDGHLVISGNDDNPLIISGDVAINGDLIVQGKVKGSGRIYVRGNIYITGDLTYDDARQSNRRTFGIAKDGSVNALSLEAAGNILIGDFLTPAGGDPFDHDQIDPGYLRNGDKMSFAAARIYVSNRSQWSPTQEFLWSPDGSLPNSGYDESHRPCFYRLYQDSPVLIYNGYKENSSGESHGVFWDASHNSWTGDAYTSTYDPQLLSGITPAELQAVRAHTVSLGPDREWISVATLKNIWIHNELERRYGDDFMIDGRLVTKHALIGFQRPVSRSGGRMIINGAIVAADLGLLAPGGLQINYDSRMESFGYKKAEYKVTMQRIAWFTK